jgi:hypothetical protein
LSEEQKRRVEERFKKFLQDEWDGNCPICGQPVEKSGLWINEMPDMINGAVLGECIEIYGHRVCVQNADNLIVMPNRARLIEFSEKIKQEVADMEEAKALLKLIDEELVPRE